MSFTKRLINIGHVMVNSKSTIEFPYEILGEIRSLTSPCDCANPINDTTKKIIKVEYVAKPIPKHLKDADRYAIRKIINVLSVSPIDGHEIHDELIFIGTVHEKL